MDSIVLDNISMKYNDEYILKNISHSFKTGRSYTFMGHNGGGKSTLLRIISGLTTPTNGKVSYSRPFKFSFVPEKFRPSNLTGRSFLKSMGTIDQIPAGRLNNQIEALAGDFFLDDMLDIPMKNLSKGTLQKISVIQAILCKPDVLLLDEPLSGQDIASQKVFVNKINNLKSHGVTVFMSCHEKWLTKAISDDVYFIKDKHIEPYTFSLSHRYYLLMQKPDASASECKLLVDEDKVQETLEKLWSDGWKLKGMYDEND